MTHTPLAVIAPRVGLPSETFIQRHVTDLLPGGTATITLGKPVAGYIHPAGAPLLAVNDLKPIGRDRVMALLGKLRGDRVPARRRSLARFIVDQGVRVVLVQYLHVAWEHLDFFRKLGIPLFAHAHGYDVAVRLQDPVWRNRYLDLASAAGVIAMSEACRTRLLSLGLSGDSVHVVPYGVDLAEVPALQSASGALRCLAVGRMVGKKAPILLLEAFRRALADCSSLRLDYVGGGDLLAAAKHFVEVFGLTDSVTLHGTQDHARVLALMRAAHVFVQHSVVDPVSGDEEGLPVAILEAMAHALPVVATRHAGIPEMVADGETGFLVAEGDVGAMAARIVQLAATRDLREAMGRAGREVVLHQFLWEHERSRLREIMGLPE